jgi:hypothetical protein
MTRLLPLSPSDNPNVHSRLGFVRRQIKWLSAGRLDCEFTNDERKLYAMLLRQERELIAALPAAER